MAPKSFALEYRKQLLAEKTMTRGAERPRPDWESIAEPAADPEATAANRARVLGALLIAAAVLGVFNSEALVHWTRGLSATAAGRQAFAIAMEWHAWMQAGSADRLVAEIRDHVTAARSAAWEDVAGPFAVQRLRAGEGMVKSAASGSKAPNEITGSVPSPVSTAKQVSQ